MSAKSILILCAQALFMQSALAYCTNRVADAGIIGVPYGLGYGLDAPCGLAGPGLEFSPTSGGALPVSSASAIAPIGLSVVSENVYEGILAAAGELPFVGTVGVEGVLPTAGAGAVNHHCGNGVNAMASDNIGFGYADAYAPGLATSGLGYRAGWAGKGCGCGI